MFVEEKKTTTKVKGRESKVARITWKFSETG
jgi:hypothetical protein